MKTVVIYPLYRMTSFWIAVGLFIYLSGNFFVAIFSQTNKDSLDFLIQLSIVVLVINLVKNILLAGALFNNDPTIEDRSDSLNVPINLDMETPNLTNLKNERE